MARVGALSSILDVFCLRQPERSAFWLTDSVICSPKQCIGNPSWRRCRPYKVVSLAKGAVTSMCSQRHYRYVPLSALGWPVCNATEAFNSASRRGATRIAHSVALTTPASRHTSYKPELAAIEQPDIKTRFWFAVVQELSFGMFRRACGVFGRSEPDGFVLFSACRGLTTV